MLLAIDTSSSQLGLALYNGAQVIAESMWTSRARHTVELAPALAELFQRTGVKVDDLQILAVALGPGSFTSLRVGLAFVKGLALARNLPLIGIQTLDWVAASQPQTQLPVAAVIPAGRVRLAVGWYRPFEVGQKAAGAAVSAQSNGSPVAMTAEELSASIIASTLVCGEMSATERGVFEKNNFVTLPSPARCMRSPGLLAEMAYTRWQAGERDDTAALAPVYLHTVE